MDLTRIAVVGGSLDGLTAASLLRDAGSEVDLHEHSAHSLSGFGTGVVVQPELTKCLTEQVGLQADELNVFSSFMRYVDACSGKDHGAIPASWRFTG